jgi:hypothetical protein
MEKQVSVVLATKLKDAADKLGEAVDYMHEHVESKERAPLARAIGDIFAIMSDEIYSRLVIANRELHDVLFRGLPEDAPEHFLQMSRYGHSAKGEE